MSRRIVVLLVVTLVVASMGAPLAVAAPTGPAHTAIGSSGSVAPQVAANNSTTTTNSTANATPPGQKLAGVIGVQGSETNGEIERRSFDRRFENANSNASKATVVGGQLQRARVRLETLEQRQERLETLHEQGNISEARYRVQMTRIVAELEQTNAILNRTESAARTVPESDLRERGVNTTELEDLRTRARNLSGPEVSAIARNLAGGAPGKGLGHDKSDDSDEDNENETSTSRGNGADKQRGKADDRERGAGTDNASDRRPTDRGNTEKGADKSNRGQQAKDAVDTILTTDSDDTSDSSEPTDDETTTTTTTTTTDSSQDGTERGTSDE